MAKTGKDSKQDWSEILDVDGKASDVNAKSYYRLFRAYANHHARHKEDVGKAINPIDDPQLWGAWGSYFKDKQMTMPHFRACGEEAMRRSKEARNDWGYQVPASLPSDFDFERTPAADLAAGNNFMAAQERKRRLVAEQENTSEERAMIVRNILRKRPPTTSEVQSYD